MMIALRGQSRSVQGTVRQNGPDMVESAPAAKVDVNATTKPGGASIFRQSREDEFTGRGPIGTFVAIAVVLPNV
jgi:hypothetical protein